MPRFHRMELAQRLRWGSVNSHSGSHKTEKKDALSIRSKQGLLSWKEGRDFSGTWQEDVQQG